MRIPRYWQKAGEPVQTPRGQTWRLEVWGWSDESDELAAAVAQGRLRAQAEAVAAGKPHERYLYSDRPLREEILEEPAPGVVITRNGYGARILNTAQVAFVDVDLDLPDSEPGFFGKLLGGRGPQEVLDEQVELLRMALKGIASARVYRTRAGLRLLLSDRLYVPNDPQTLNLMEALGSDPLYRTLCREQECFRARLTPKPWRCGKQSFPCRWPYPDPEVARRWVEGYEIACTSRAATHYVTTLGSEEVHEDVRAVVDLHDRLSGANSGFPLA